MSSIKLLIILKTTYTILIKTLILISGDFFSPLRESWNMCGWCSSDSRISIFFIFYRIKGNLFLHSFEIAQYFWRIAWRWGTDCRGGRRGCSSETFPGLPGPEILPLLKDQSRDFGLIKNSRLEYKNMCTATKIPLMYSFSGNSVASASVSTLMCLWSIYIFPGSVYIFPPAE
jgi:hypothetical protein